MIELPQFIQDADRPWRYGNCDACPLSPKVVRGYGVGGGIAIVGEAPGADELSKGQPFVGMSGKLIRAILQGLGQDPEQVYWANSLLCRPPSGKPHRDAVVACNNRLHDELRAAGVTKVLLLGGIALQALMSPSRPISIMRNRGKGMMIMLGTQPIYAVATYHPAAVLRQTDMFQDLVQDTRKFLEHDRPIKTQKPHVFVSWKPEQAIRRLEEIQGASRMSCDLETTGFSTVDDMVVSIGFAVRREDNEIEAHIIPQNIARDPRVDKLLLHLFKGWDGIMSLHNAKFDLRFLSAFFKQPIKRRPHTMHDTMLMSYVLDERPSSPHGLKPLARFYFDADDYAFDFDEFFAIKEPSKQDFERFFYYQGLDCSYTLQLDELFSARLDKEKEETNFRGWELLENLLYPASYAFQDIENTGIMLDMPYMQEWERTQSEYVDTLHKRLAKLVKEDSGITGFNPASAPQVKRLVYDTWKTPKQQTMFSKSKQWKQEVGSSEWPTGSTVLSRIAETIGDPRRKEILISIWKWRQGRTLLNTHIRGMQKAASTDGRVHSFFFLHGTVTGRLSSTRPNLQNIPARRGSEAEKSFCAPPGWSIIAADYSQLELRVLAVFSQDPNLIRIFAEGLDIHSEVGSQIFQKDPKDITVLERKLTKTMVFGVLYGRGAESIVLGHEVAYMVRETDAKRWTKEDAQGFQRRLLASYPGMKNFFDTAKRQAVEQHYVETITGRRRRFPFITDANRGEVMRQAANAPIQGTASDMCLTGLIRLNNHIPHERGRVLSMVHDAILLEVDNNYLKETLIEVRDTMEQQTLLDTDVPFKVEVKVGPSWGDAKKVTWDENGQPRVSIADGYAVTIPL